MEEVKELSQLELEQMRMKHIEYLQKNIEVLELEARSEELLTKIDESRTKRLAYNVQYLQMKNQINQKDAVKETESNNDIDDNKIADKTVLRKV